MTSESTAPATASQLDVFEDLRRRVDARLESVLTESESDASRRAKDAVDTVVQVRDLTMRGGKRLRPAMLLAAVECVVEWKTLAAAVVDTSCGIELLQTYLLIHDDWMDGDAVRRGGPTVHVSLAKRYNDDHLGASAAILAGDFASALAQDMALSPSVPKARLFDVARAFITMQREVVLGQTLDVLNSSDLEAIHDLKTGSYTVRGPIALGHALAGGSPEQWSALEAFANPLGVAFQLRDDLIGAFGDEKETGKSAASDLRQAKMSAPVRWALERLPEAKKSELRSVLGTDQYVRAQELLIESGAPEGVERRIDELEAKALAALESPALRREGARLLARLAALMCKRKK
ncbi:MAG: polyprenyl synthetase family protein [Myxococcales bacterium]|nr:polyprenyl synthetase family protein [Myxococcales bacterium]